MNEERINKYLNSRYCLVTMAVVSIILSYLAFLFYGKDVLSCNGLFAARAENWIEAPATAWMANVVLSFVVAVLLFNLNRVYAFIREFTLIHVSAFTFITLSNPTVSATFSASNLHAALILVCTTILFHSFQQKLQRGTIFLVGFLLSLCSVFDYAALFYIPVFFIGFMQVQAMSFRGFLAMAVGVLLPYWIGYGFGWIDFQQFTLPDLAITWEKYRDTFDPVNAVRVIITAATGTILGFSNVFKIMATRLQLRSYNGFFNLLAVATLIFMVVDVANVNTYIVTLNCCVAIQIAHFFSIHKFTRRYMLFFSLLLLYLACTTADLLKPLLTQ